MFQLSRQLEYSLMTLKALSEKQGLVAAREIADKLKIPYDNVAKSLQKFNKLKITESVQGVKGGYQLKADLTKLSLLEVMEGLEGTMSVVRCQSESGSFCDKVADCNILNPADRLNSLFMKILRDQTVAEFFGHSPKGNDSEDYAIWR